MDMRIYFEFENSDRKPIALAINGEAVGLQTGSFHGKRVYAFFLANYEKPMIDLSLISLENETNVTVYLVNEAEKIMISNSVFLAAGRQPTNLQFNTAQLGLTESAAKPYYDISPETFFPPKKLGGRTNLRKLPKDNPSTAKASNLKIDLEFYTKQTKRKDLLTAKADEPQNTLIDVFYATDRGQEISKKGKVSYTNKRGDLNLGRCVVNVPADRKKGEMPLPPWYLFGLYTSEDKHMILKTIQPLEPHQFFEALQSKISASPEKDAFIFIHGFNVSFEESIMRAGQIAVDIGFHGAPIVYSWPSVEKVGGYTADEATTTGYSLDNIIQLIKDVRVNTGAERVHLIAHSMGNRLLTEALKAMVYEGFTKEFVFNQIILAAPDIDAEVFVKHLAPKIAGAGKQVTLYTSVHDKALWLSEKIHGNNLRLGGSGDALAICDGIDTIDASEERTDMLGHGYFAESKAMIDDIFHAIRFGRSPAERNLRMRITGKLFYWDFN